MKDFQPYMCSFHYDQVTDIRKNISRCSSLSVGPTLTFSESIIKNGKSTLFD